MPMRAFLRETFTAKAVLLAVFILAGMVLFQYAGERLMASHDAQNVSQTGGR